MNDSRSLQFYIQLFFIATSIVSFLLIGGYVAYNYHKELRDNLRHSLTVMAEDVVHHGLYTLDAQELPGIFHFLEDYHDNPFVELFDDLHFAYSPTKPLFPDTTVAATRPLPDGRYLSISSTLENVTAKTTMLIFKLLFVFGGVLCIAILVYSYYLNRLFAPLHCLVRFCRDSSEHHEQLQRCHGTSDINRLKEAIIDLLDTRHDIFKETAHEIKSPLAILKARVSLYKQEPDYDKALFVAETLEDINTISDKLKEVLFLNAVEFDMRQPKESISLQSQCFMMQQAFRPILEKKGVSLEADWDNDFSLHIHKYAFEKVMYAIFENIFLHTKNGTTIYVNVNATVKELHITNEIGTKNDEMLFSSRIGSKMIHRLADRLDYDYTTAQDGTRFVTTIRFARNHAGAMPLRISRDS